MPTRKIRDIRDQEVFGYQQICRDPEHHAPSMWCPDPGVYEHECPRCGHKFEFVIRRPNYLGNANDPRFRPSLGGDLNPLPEEAEFKPAEGDNKKWWQTISNAFRMRHE